MAKKKEQQADEHINPDMSSPEWCKYPGPHPAVEIRGAGWFERDRPVRVTPEMAPAIASGKLVHCDAPAYVVTLLRAADDYAMPEDETTPNG